MNRVKSIKVDDSTHKHLQRLGNKGESFNDIIHDLIVGELLRKMEEDFHLIDDYSDEADIKGLSIDEITSKVQIILSKIWFDWGIHPEWDLKEVISHRAINGNTILSDVVKDTYCIYLGLLLPETNKELKVRAINGTKDSYATSYPLRKLGGIIESIKDNYFNYYNGGETDSTEATLSYYREGFSYNQQMIIKYDSLEQCREVEKSIKALLPPENFKPRKW